jgi:hypothetical protein
VTFRRNRVTRTRNGLNLSATASAAKVIGSGRTSRILFEDVVFELDGTTNVQLGMQILGTVRDMAVRNVWTQGRLNLEQDPKVRLIVENSCFHSVKGCGLAEGTNTITTQMPDGMWRSNRIVRAARLNMYPRSDGNVVETNGTCPIS